MSLEARAAAALSADIASADLAELIAETEVAITAADAAAEEERLNALDPVASPDPVEARAAMEAAAFTCGRLRNVLPRLQARLKQVEDQEYFTQWHSDYEALEVKRDALAEEFKEVYPTCVAKIVDLFTRVEANDEELSRLHQARQCGVRLHLLGAELTARGVERLMQPDIVITKELRLPAFDRAGGPVIAWPPPRPTFAQQCLASVLAQQSAPFVALTPEQVRARNAAQLAERNEAGHRAFDLMVERDRQREAREFEAGREAMAREVAERNKREGWF